MTVILLKAFLHLFGMVCWLRLLLLLLQVVVCKDARTLDINRLKEIPISARIRLFMGSLKDKFYVGSILLFIATLFASLKMMNEMYYYIFPIKNWVWLLFHPLIAIGIYKIYKSRGYRLEIIEKFKIFWNE